MPEILPYSDFYPFKNLRKLKQFDKKPIEEGFEIDLARVKKTFQGANLIFRLLTNQDCMDRLSKAETPIGEVPVDYNFVDGFYLLRKTPLEVFVELNTKNIETIRKVQWYELNFIFGENSYPVDFTDDWDYGFDEEPKELRPGQKFTIGSGIYSFYENFEGVALPYDIARIRKIKCRFIDQPLPE